MRTGATSFATRRGYTLAESLIASVVLAAAIVGLSGTLSASYQQDAVRGNTNTALLFAQELMEEIAALPVDVPSGQTDKPGWSAGQTDRTKYDNITDFDGYTDVSSSVTAWDGSSVDLGDGGTYTRTVKVTQNALPSGMTGTASDFYLVTVSVSMPKGQSISISQLFTRVSMYR